MKSTKNSRRVRSRRSRDENKEVTRSKIVAMGRKHFLSEGYAGTVLEQVAEEAGFSRGALYSNFSGKEELFLAVFETDLHMHVSRYHDVLDGNTVGTVCIDKLRDAFVRHVTDRPWAMLRTEFELVAIHSKLLRKRFSQIHRRDFDNAVALANKAIVEGDLVLNDSVENFILATQSFMLGLAIKQRLLPRALAAVKCQAIAGAFFDCFIAAPLKKGAERRALQAD